MDTLDIKGIAKVLNLHPKHVRDRLVHRPGFPAPVLDGGRYSRQWLKDEVIAWATPAARRCPQPSHGSTSKAATTGHDAR